jgi:hypothetical protein
MTETEWLACAHPGQLLQFFGGRLTQRKTRLFACACCRLLGPVLTNPNIRVGLASAEEYADESHDWGRMRDATAFLYNLDEDIRGRAMTALTIGGAVGEAVRYWGAKLSNGTDLGAYVAEAKLFRDIFGNPFRPSGPLSREILGWNNATIRRIAEGVYEERAFEHLPILHDVLLDAGCDNEDILAHCRERGPHVRGCWVVDLILAKT